MCQKTSTFLFFEQLCQKLTNFSNFWYVKSLRQFDMKILHSCLPQRSDVATLPSEIQKSFFNSIICLRCYQLWYRSAYVQMLTGQLSTLDRIRNEYRPECIDAVWMWNQGRMARFIADKPLVIPLTQAILNTFTASQTE